MVLINSFKWARSNSSQLSYFNFELMNEKTILQTFCGWLDCKDPYTERQVSAIDAIVVSTFQRFVRMQKTSSTLPFGQTHGNM